MMSTQSLANDEKEVVVDDENRSNKNPSPADFDVFLPWACGQLSVDADIIIVRILNTPYVSPYTLQLKKKKPSHPEVSTSELAVVDDHKSVSMDNLTMGATVKLYTVYDIAGNLLELKFYKNKKIPRVLLKIISLVLQYHTSLTKITINRGLNNVLLHELNNFLKLSTINHICLDNTVITDGSYDILLENESNLNNLSLSRCLIDDNIIKKIASKFSYPLPASKKLSILNLSSNRITNVGAKYLADALRSNRSLLYLNLSDNLIEDEGAIAILDVLQEFAMSEEESLDSKARYVAYVKEKLKQTSIYEPVITGESKKIIRRKSLKDISANTTHPIKTLKPSEKDPLRKMSFEENYIKDPFLHNNIRCSKDNVLQCYGNNYLAYLNLSYNSIGYFTLKSILSVLTYQNMMNWQPKGLVRLCIEGNCIPDCVELIQINDILQKIIETHNKKMSIMTKKTIRSRLFTKS